MSRFKFFSHQDIAAEQYIKGDFSFTKKWNNADSATTSQPYRTFEINNTYVTIVTVYF
jgi:hypothetical protein